MQNLPLGNTHLRIPRVVFGTSCLGNLYEQIPHETKLSICKAWFEAIDTRPVVIDTAGKYGAGLALEVIGDCLRALKIPPQDVVISNKLAWKSTELRRSEPTFEPGVWANLRHDARQCISYDGILECWEQGCQLLGEPYRPALVSVHDPDEYLAAAKTTDERNRRLTSVLEAYAALADLKKCGQVQAVGVGAKDWKVIREISAHVRLDWVMLAGCLTLYKHSAEVVEFIDQLAAQGVGIINSAVFQAGFLVGGDYLDYRLASPETDEEAYAWRDRLNRLCAEYQVAPATACIQFGLSPPGVVAVALNTSNSTQVFDNVASVAATIPREFWDAAKTAGLVSPAYSFVGSGV